MEHEIKPTTNSQTSQRSITDFDDGDKFTEQRLDFLLEANAEIARAKSMYLSERERREAALIKNPLSVEDTFARFGMLLGIFPPTAFFVRLFTVSRIFQGEDFWILGVVAIVVLISAVVGYLSGRRIGRIVFELEKKSWSKMLLALPFVGIFWGLMAGGAGGTVIFVVGALFGAVIGGLVGAAALPIFAIFHRLLKRGDKIDGRHFLPLAFGISLIVSAFLLGF